MAAGDRPEEGCAGETGISDELRGRLICRERTMLQDQLIDLMGIAHALSMELTTTSAWALML